MPVLTYRGDRYDCRAGETVLDALMRQGADVPFSCRNGVCHVCVQRCIGGELPAESQHDVRPSLAALGYFLPCRCRPERDLEIAAPRPEDLFTQATVVGKTLLTPTICRLLLEPHINLDYRPGQFVNLRRADGTVRSYSLASLPEDEPYLELHVKRMRNGVMSNWIFDALEPGDTLELQGPEGRGTYDAERPDEDLLLIGSGTGLAPLLGILREALHVGHQGGIRLVHGASDASEIYLRDELMALADKHANFHYTACVRRGSRPSGVLEGRAQEVAFGLYPTVRSWRVYLAGPEELVTTANTMALRAGVPPDHIHADPFVYRDLRGTPRGTLVDEGARQYAPDPEMWTALRDGRLLTEILTDFYTRVFEDPQLAPYFRGATRQRLIEKVYSFMYQLFTGEKVYFGDRPRNAHHWMVISDELFDHREALMVSVLRRHGLPEHLIQRWRAIEESFRGDIVKRTPWPKVSGGVEMPLDGYAESIIEVGSLCDGCDGEIRQGELVRYHVRIGATYCSRCAGRAFEA